MIRERKQRECKRQKQEKKRKAKKERKLTSKPAATTNLGTS